MVYPKVVISIPTFNHAKFISRAIDSALKVDYDNLHINVCDDCSTDDTWDQCQQYKGIEKISLFRNHSNIGRVKNYQKLFYELGADAEWIINLDGDDFFISTDFIRKAIDTILSLNGKYDVVLYHYQFSLTPFKKFPGAGRAGKLVHGTEYVVNRPLVNSFFHFGAIVKRKSALSTNFYHYPSLNTDALSIQELALQGYAIVDAVKVGSWSLNENSETKKSFSENEIQLYESANNSFKQLLHRSLSQKQLDKYYRNLEVVIAKDEVVALFHKRRIKDAIRRLVGCPNILHFFSKEVLNSFIRP